MRPLAIILVVVCLMLLPLGPAHAGDDGPPPAWYLDEMKRIPIPKLTAAEASALAKKDSAAKVAFAQRIAGRSVSGSVAAAAPNGYQIFHWIAVRGYGNYGSTTRFADSASGLGGIFSGVPAYNEYDSCQMAVIFGGRGYIW